MALSFEDEKNPPHFLEHAKTGKTEEQGWVLYYTAQCPHTARYAPALAAYAKTRGITVKTVKIDTLKEAGSAPDPFTTHALFYNGNFITNEILSEKSFETLLMKLPLEEM